MNRNLQKFLSNFGVGLAVAFLVMWGRGVFEAETASDVLRLICDGFFVAAAFLLAWGGLRWCTNGGAVDGLGYSLKMVKERMLPFLSRPWDKRESFAEYRERRERKSRPARYLLLSGLAHLVVALILFAAYNFV